MRVFFNFLALWSLGVSLLFAVFDIARSIAQLRLVVKPFLQSLQDYLPEYLAAFAGFIRQVFWSGFWDNWMVPVLNMPGWFLFLVLSIVCFAAGTIGRKSYAR